MHAARGRAAYVDEEVGVVEQLLQQGLGGDVAPDDQLLNKKLFEFEKFNRTSFHSCFLSRCTGPSMRRKVTAPIAV